MTLMPRSGHETGDLAMNVSIGKTWEQYVAEQVESGQFGNASEVVRDALRRQQEHFVKLEALRREVGKGVASIKAGRISRATADDIIRKATERKQEA
jgi:antitoxin ParD1/3/4